PAWPGTAYWTKAGFRCGPPPAARRADRRRGAAISASAWPSSSGCAPRSAGGSSSRRASRGLRVASRSATPLNDRLSIGAAGITAVAARVRASEAERGKHDERPVPAGAACLRADPSPVAGDESPFLARLRRDLVVARRRRGTHGPAVAVAAAAVTGGRDPLRQCRLGNVAGRPFPVADARGRAVRAQAAAVVLAGA